MRFDILYLSKFFFFIIPSQSKSVWGIHTIYKIQIQLGRVQDDISQYFSRDMKRYDYGYNDDVYSNSEILC